MKILILTILLISRIIFGQDNDSVRLIPTIPKPPSGPVTSFGNIYEDVNYDLEWTDSIIPKIRKITITQLSPFCEEKKRKRPVQNDKYSKTNCYMESVIILETITVNQEDTTYYGPNKNIIGFKIDKFYREREIDSIDYNTIIPATLGKRKSYSMDMCYNPRHAVVFYDSKNSIIGIYEICFECGNATLGFNQKDYFSIHSEDYGILKELFIKYKRLKPEKKK